MVPFGLIFGDGHDFTVCELTSVGAGCVCFDLKPVAFADCQLARAAYRQTVEVGVPDFSQFAVRLDDDACGCCGDYCASLDVFRPPNDSCGVFRVESGVGLLCDRIKSELMVYSPSPSFPASRRRKKPLREKIFKKYSTVRLRISTRSGSEDGKPPILFESRRSTVAADFLASQRPAHLPVDIRIFGDRPRLSGDRFRIAQTAFAPSIHHRHLSQKPSQTRAQKVRRRGA